MSKNRRQVLTEIQHDAENDARKWDGRELTGRNVATMHGETLAMVSALAHIVDSVVEELEDG